MTETAVNESLKHVCKAKESIKAYLELNDIANQALLTITLELLEKTEELLVSTM